MQAKTGGLIELCFFTICVRTKNKVQYFPQMRQFVLKIEIMKNEKKPHHFLKMGGQ